jgi:meiotic recombination protein SPO11
MSTYKYGSLAHLHKNAELSLPPLQWLGLKIADAADETQNSSGELSFFLAARDRKKIVSMLRRSPIWASDGVEPEWCAELQRMLMLNVKVEIEKLYDDGGSLEEWIDRKMFRQR